MNQIAASILILSASILGYTATLRTSNEGFGGIFGLLAIGLGLWGCMALLTASLREREIAFDDSSLTRVGSAAMNGLQNLTYSGQRASGGLGQDYHVSAETNARVTAAAQLRGQNRQEVVEETLRRHLPKYSSPAA